ncbi:MAG: 2-dehydro-3-deoxy-6-phosphogalactonate aldolase [Pseudomonadota bacterium]
MSDPKSMIRSKLDALPLLAILRGLEPRDAHWVGDVLVDAGITTLEVPLNSPNPFSSIDILCKRFGDIAIVGAGTVTHIADVARLADCGGQLVVSPNTDCAVIAETVRRGMIACPGCFTPTEAFAALGAGAHGLKLFPASVIGAAGIKAMSATFPEDTLMLAVGGVGPLNMSEYWAAGVQGFGLGSALFKPGIARDALTERAKACVSVAETLSSAH